MVIENYRNFIVIESDSQGTIIVNKTGFYRKIIDIEKYCVLEDVIEAHFSYQNNSCSKLQLSKMISSKDQSYQKLFQQKIIAIENDFYRKIIVIQSDFQRKIIVKKSDFFRKIVVFEKYFALEDVIEAY